MKDREWGRNGFVHLVGELVDVVGVEKHLNVEVIDLFHHQDVGLE